MAQPTSIFVTPSTTVVQVDTLQTPYTPVILNKAEYSGQVVTVYTILSTLQILENPIVVSTISTMFFPTSNSSTLIQQPQGFITVQTRLPNQWTVLNSYPFRDQFFSAGTQFFTTSTVYTAAICTIMDRTSSLNVENLIVSGDFFLSTGLSLTTTVSSFGIVNIASSLTVLGDTYFSSFVSSTGPLLFASTLSVGKDFVSLSSFQFGSSLFGMKSLSIVGDISTSLIQLEGGFAAPIVEVQTSSGVCMDIAGTMDIGNSLSTLSSVYLGGSLNLNAVYIQGDFSTFSSVSVEESFFVGSNSFISTNLSIDGSLSIGNNLTVDGDLSIQSTLTGTNLVILGSMENLGFLSTHSLEAEKGLVFGDLFVVSSAVVSTQNLFIDGSLGFKDLQAETLRIGGVLSTTSDLVGLNGVFGQGYLFVHGGLSTIGSLSVAQDLYVLRSLSVGNDLLVSGGMTLLGNLDVLSTFYTNRNSTLSTVVGNDFTVTDSIYVTGTTIVSSIVLPESVLSYNFIVSTLTTEEMGIADTVQISSLQTSSLATGGLLSAEYTMDMANVLQALRLSTFLLSTGILNPSYPFLENFTEAYPSTFFQVTSSVGVNMSPLLNRFQVNAVGYTLNDTYVQQVFSTLTIQGNTVQGVFSGNAEFLSNINYPESLSTFLVSTSHITSEKISTSLALASTGLVLDSFQSLSTLRIGDFFIYGNAKNDTSSLVTYMLTKNDDPNLLVLNNMYCLKSPPQVVVNPNVIPTLDSSYILGIGGSLRINNLASQTFFLKLDSFYGDVVVGCNVGDFGMNTIYVSTGIIGKSQGTFFIPESSQPLFVSTNTIQPYLSSLWFNSTLTVNRLSKNVGINTVPTFTLDVLGDVQTKKGIVVTQSTVLAGQLDIQQQQSSFWLAVTSNSLTSNLVYSSNDGVSWETFSPGNPSQGNILLNVGYSGGPLVSTTSNTLMSDRIWVATGALVQWYRETEQTWIQATNPTAFAFSNYGIAYNGTLWVVTGVNPGGVSPASYAPLQWSSDGKTWTAAASGGFTWDGVSTWYGGRSVAWNGSYWVAIGKGASLENSIVYSGDGKNWSNVTIGAFVNGGYGITWTGKNWVATGDNGSSVSSFAVSTDGLEWTAIGGYGFASASSHQGGNAITTDGTLVVAVGTFLTASGKATIQYSEDYGRTWSNASGSLFDTVGNEGASIVWNGQYWLAGGSSGIRKSFNGKTWTQPSGASYRFQGLSYTSNALPILQLGTSNNILRVYNTPDNGILLWSSSPTISYTSTSLSLNNTLTIDRFKNVGILPYPNGQQSTFYEMGLATVSTFVSTHSAQVGAYFVSVGIV